MKNGLSKYIAFKVFFATSLLFFFGCAVAPVTKPALTRTDMKLVWEDDFSKDKPGLPDPTKWGYEEGYIRNKELQYYTAARVENARVENGMLIIEARKDNYKGNKYTSASLITKNKAEWTYGRIEMLAKLPKGDGVWPAFWTLGTNHKWPQGGEIDIMEYVGKEPGIIYSTIHWDSDGHKSRGGRITQQEPGEDFHVYAAEWYPDRIDFFVDEKLYFTTSLEDTESCFDHPHYLLVNFALGGSWGGELDDSILPQQYQIKYIRVYSKE